MVTSGNKWYFGCELNNKVNNRWQQGFTFNFQTVDFIP